MRSPPVCLRSRPGRLFAAKPDDDGAYLGTHRGRRRSIRDGKERRPDGGHGVLLPEAPRRSRYRGLEYRPSQHALAQHMGTLSCHQGHYLVYVLAAVGSFARDVSGTCGMVTPRSSEEDVKTCTSRPVSFPSLLGDVRCFGGCCHSRFRLGMMIARWRREGRESSRNKRSTPGHSAAQAAWPSLRGRR
jgi:hypothetical protein